MPQHLAAGERTPPGSDAEQQAFEPVEIDQGVTFG
jgi:hypothetical protein